MPMESEVFCRSEFKYSTIIRMKVGVARENFHRVAVCINYEDL